MGPKRSEGARVSKSSKDSEKHKHSEKPKDSEKVKDSNKRRRTSPQSGNPRQGPGPTTSTQGGQAADEPSSRRSGAPFDASSLSDRELQKATTGFAALSMAAYAPPPSGTPAWELPSHAPYYQPQTPFPSSQHGQYGAYPSGQYGKYGAYPSNQPGQHNAHQSEQARFYQKPITPSPYSNNPPATGMGTASAVPVGHQPETRDPTKSRRATAPQPSLGEEPRRRGRKPGQQQSRHWEDAEDEKLVYLKGQYDNQRDKWGHIAEAMSKTFKQDITPFDCERRWDNNHKELKAKRKLLAANPASFDLSASEDETWSREEDEELVYLRGQYDIYSDKWVLTAQGMYRAGFTNRTEYDCERRWNKVLKKRTRNFKPKDWSKEEDNRLTKLVKHFDKWDTLNGWQEISDQMRAAGSRRAPENCRTRWQETLRGPANFGNWAEDEEKFLDDLGSQYSPVELVDLLERRLHSIRSVEHCTQKLLRLRQGPVVTLSRENTVDWWPDADRKLNDFNEGKKKVSHKAAAEELNKVFHTSIFTPGKCEKRWGMIK